MIDDIDLLTEQMLSDPQPGDHFQEMLSFDLFVLARDGERVTTMEGQLYKLPSDGVIHVYDSPNHLRQRLSYKSIKGYWVQGVRRGRDVANWLEAV